MSIVSYLPQAFIQQPVLPVLTLNILISKVWLSLHLLFLFLFKVEADQIIIIINNNNKVETDPI